MGDTLKGQVAIVTGASGGLGAHFARVLAAEGAAVAVTARRLDKVEAIAGELAGAGHRAMALRLDVADAASIQPAFTEIEAALGPVSILINNAGVGGEGAALDLSVDDFAGLGQKQPLTAAMLSIVLLSLIGVPLTGGFFRRDPNLRLASSLPARCRRARS